MSAQNREMVSCKSFQNTDTDMWQYIQSGLHLGFVIEVRSLGSTYMVNIYKR